MAETEKKEPWIQWVALTTTILAVCAAISTLRANSYSTRVQLYTTKEANHWAYYQAKNIRGYSYKLNRDLLTVSKMETKNPEAQEYLEAKIQEYDKQIARYDKEKAQIKVEAENFQKDQETFKHHNAAFALAVMLSQIAIMMSAVGALVKRPALWYLGLVFGAGGLVYMCNGFFLWF